MSKTDLQGRITYCNHVFVRVSGFSEQELLGQAHSVIRHPEMPRCIFKLLWDTLKSGRELFAYVNNLAKSGDNYWVFAHITPSFDGKGEVVGYHSNRRLPYPDALPKVRELYEALFEEEQRYSNRDRALEASTTLLRQELARAGMPYDEFVFSLSAQTQLTRSA